MLKTRILAGIPRKAGIPKLSILDKKARIPPLAIPGSKVKGYIEQKKAIHEVKKILHKAGKLEKYTEDELNTPI